MKNGLFPKCIKQILLSFYCSERCVMSVISNFLDILSNIFWFINHLNLKVLIVNCFKIFNLSNQTYLCCSSQTLSGLLIIFCRMMVLYILTIRVKHVIFSSKRALQERFSRLMGGSNNKKKIVCFTEQNFIQDTLDINFDVYHKKNIDKNL